MHILRPISESDFPALLEIARESGVGFTSLPVNEDLLKKKIAQSVQSFNTEADKRAGSYLFVMQDPEGIVQGTSGIEACVGLDDAFYHYHRSKVVHASRELAVHNTVELLTLCNDYTGVSEICTLFLREKARKGQLGRFLSKSRFLFMIEHAEQFSETVIAEMRGVSDDQGRSPFWEWLEKSFFSMDFPTADYLTGIGNKVFIAELMPKYPIYVNLLSEAAQQVIGKVHDKTVPALRLLEQEGFVNRGYVDIFDAGPTVEANLANIRTAQQSKKLPVKIDTQHAISGNTHYIINTSIADFRAVCTECLVTDNQQHLIICEQTAHALSIKEGEYVRFSAANHFQ